MKKKKSRQLARAWEHDLADPAALVVQDARLDQLDLAPLSNQH
jgi:hypothetical protein